MWWWCALALVVAGWWLARATRTWAQACALRRYRGQTTRRMEAWCACAALWPLYWSGARPVPADDDDRWP